MRIQSVALLLAGCLSLSASSSVAQPIAPLAVRVAIQNALFEEQYQNDLKELPQTATAYGDYRYNDRLNDYSLAAIARRHTADVAYLARLQAIATSGFAEPDQLSHDLMLRILQQRLADYDLKEYEMNGDTPGAVTIHTRLADLPLAVPLDTVAHYDDYLARLHQIPRAFTQTEEVLRAGLKDHLMPVKFLIEKTPVECQGIVAADPFLMPTRKYPASFSVEDQQRLTQAITDAVNTEVLPAYAAFAAFVTTEYAPHGRTALAISSLPDGRKRYQNDLLERTTTNLTPEVIHQLGLREIARIEAEMTVIAKQQGFADLDHFRASLKTNPTYQANSSEQILDNFRRYIAQMQPRLTELFTFIPGSPVTVEAIPAFQPARSTHYQPGTPDGMRPGRVSVQTSDPTHRTLLADEATAYHEGIPGHHMQLSVQQQLKNVPQFRLHGGNTAYIEGWALYTEQLGKEIGFYQDPVSDYGRLSSELFRAVRLVVDTGIHAQGWTRDQVVAFFRKADCIDEPTIQAETDRYIAAPAQALSYKLGQLKFRELRDRAQKALGPKFDIRTFHDEMLSSGVLPLDMLDARTNTWIAAQRGCPGPC
jgi:uncharacterized protein (DUF885 family)